MSVDDEPVPCQMVCDAAAPKTVRGSQQKLHVIKRKQAAVASSTESDIGPRIYLQWGIEPRDGSPEKPAHPLRRMNSQAARNVALSPTTYILKQADVTLISMFPG
jgi:hypothetical protein